MLVMLKKAWFFIFCCFLLTVGCTSVNSSSRQDLPNNSNEITTSNTDRRNKLRDSSKERLRQRIKQISETAQGRVGVTATVLETRESVSLDGNQRFPMQSVYKFPIAMAVLAQVDRGKLKLNQKIRIELSDIVQDSQVLDEKSQGMELSLGGTIEVHGF
jgi:beta-lactamase class A